MENIRRVSVQDMLAARDQRAQKQREFLQRHGVPLISFTMNIAGEIKLDPLILRAFREGVRRVRRELSRMGAPVLEEQQSVSFTGCEMLWAVRFDAQWLKRRMRLMEEADALGRLFDIDVLDADGTHLTRGGERSCLICGMPVRACARSRAHPAQELYEKTHEIIRAHFFEEQVRLTGTMAQRALLYEAVTTPKPGLVDAENTGAHRDMDLFSFMDSAAVLRGWFEHCVRLGAAHADAEQLQYAGMQAEDQMLALVRANTHKGAIFSLGILCHAIGFLGEGASMEDILHSASETGAVFLRQMKEKPFAITGGEQQYRQYGLTGARGEAASGFQSATQIGLPALEGALGEGKSLPEAGLWALVHLMAQVHDSNIIRRAGMEGQQWVMQQAREALACGLCNLREMNARFVERNISPGGSADLLAITYFLHFWQSCREE